MSKLSQSTVDAITAAVAAAIAAQGAPVTAAAKAPTFATKAVIAAGGGFPCAAAEPCSRVLRTHKRSLSHGIEAGHEAR